MEETGINDEIYNMVSEPAVGYMPSRPSVLSRHTPRDPNFNGVDFGYARTIEELNAALDEADAERNNPTKWVTAAEFHKRIEQKYPWLT